jgi:hypothetical protein
VCLHSGPAWIPFPLGQDDIDVLVRQLRVDRDRAVLLLRENNFDLIDALLRSWAPGGGEGTPGGRVDWFV